MNEKNVHILLFDGVCNLCNGSVQFIIKQDLKKKFKFAALQSESGQMLLKKFNLSSIQFDSLVYLVDEKYYLKSDAVLRIFKTLGGFWKLIWLFHYLPQRFRNFIYDRIAKSRYSIFGKKDQCMIPSPALKNRFL